MRLTGRQVAFEVMLAVVMVLREEEKFRTSSREKEQIEAF